MFISSVIKTFTGNWVIFGIRILTYCAFHKHANSEVQKPTDDWVFCCRQSWFVICDWWILIRFVCFCVSRFVACDRNYDWRQRKTQLWRRLLNFRVRVFVKSAVIVKIISNQSPWVFRTITKKENFVFYLIGSTKRAIPIISGSLIVSTKFYH